MSINYWRYKEGTDDGCAIYQCLSCYKAWESRTAPGFHSVEGVYHPYFHFCPCCGVKWEGCRMTDPENYREWQNHGPRRQRIEAAVERRRESENAAYYASGAHWRNEPYPGSPPDPPYWLVMEEAERGGPYSRANETLEWRPVRKMNGWNASARKMLEYARQCLKQREIDAHANHDYDEIARNYPPKELYVRVVVKRNIRKQEQHRMLSEVYNR